MGTNLYGGFGEAECDQNLHAGGGCAVVVFGIVHPIKITCIVAIDSCVWDLQSILFRISIEM